MNPVRPWTTLALTLGTALLLVPAASHAQSNRLIINRGATQQATVTLTPDSNVSIDAVTGNVIIDCAPNPTNSTLCADPLGGTGGNPPPAFTIAASQFSQLETAGVYPPLTQFRIAPVGLDAAYEACRRIASGTGTSWSGVALAGDATVSTVTLPAASTSYNFSLRCFAETGARTSNVLTVATGEGTVIPPSSCPTNDIWTGQPWANFSRHPARRFTDLRRLVGGFSSEFPRLGGSIVFGANANQYVSVQFEASDAQNFDGLLKNLGWIEAQGGGAAPAQLSGVYFSITKCPGDFRLPPANNLPDPNEHTLNLGCRNIGLFGGSRFIGSTIAYAINGTPNNNECALVLNDTYYLNFITVNPLNGYGVNEHNCQGTATPCGVQLQSQ